MVRVNSSLEGGQRRGTTKISFRKYFILFETHEITSFNPLQIKIDTCSQRGKSNKLPPLKEDRGG